MGIDQLRLIDTGLDPVTAEREQWDDGNNTLAIEPKVAVAYERNVETNKRLVEARHRSHPYRRVRAGLGSRRAAVHVLPDRPRARALSQSRLMCTEPAALCPEPVEGTTSALRRAQRASTRRGSRPLDLGSRS